MNWGMYNEKQQFLYMKLQKMYGVTVNNARAAVTKKVIIFVISNESMATV